MTAAFIQAMEEILEVESGTLTDATDFKALPAWDSLAALSTLALIEDTFGKAIDPLELKNCDSIGDLLIRVKAG